MNDGVWLEACAVFNSLHPGLALLAEAEAQLD
jgi:hypothetical protein